ncbi:PF20097 family protein [Dysosmobacter sp.]|uniref:PF20097 family protein n=1 Tax=Dysosmobacter sp. TaxID=2591382 RepID=UPI003FA4578E
MKCPYCNKEMESGYIQCRDGINWTPKKQLVAALSFLGKDRVSLANGENGDWSAAITFMCTACRKTPA